MLIEKCSTPPNSILNKYVNMPGAYTDSYLTEIPAQVSFSDYVLAFYTTPLFKVERLILKIVVRKPSTDQEARELADDTRSQFATWTVEDRSANQILMCDFAGNTRSWLMSIQTENGTRLYFGSAVVPQHRSKDGGPSLGFVFRVLLGFHKIYSVLLLSSARTRLLYR
jgi:hypothetical protein